MLKSVFYLMASSLLVGSAFASNGIPRGKNCIQLAATTEESILSPEYPLFRLLTLNCLAQKLYAKSSTAKKTFFPKRLTKKLVASFPASTVPPISDDDLQQRVGKKLLTYEKGCDFD